MNLLDFVLKRIRVNLCYRVTLPLFAFFTQSSTVSAKLSSTFVLKGRPTGCFALLHKRLISLGSHSGPELPGIFQNSSRARKQ